MMPTADALTLLTALVAVFGMAGLVWGLVAVGLRESPWACACLAGTNLLLGASLLMHASLGLAGVGQFWISDTLSLAAFGLVRVAVPLVEDRRPPWRFTLVLVLATGAALSQLGDWERMALHKALLYGALAWLSLMSSLDTFRLLRERHLHRRMALLLAAPMMVVAVLLLARPLEALLAPGRSADISVGSGFNLAWLWSTLVLALTLNGTLAFLLLMKLILQIRRLTQRDPLTDVLNRRALATAMDQEHARHRRGHGYALVMLDMDRFKQLNDSLGHAAGDAALQALAHVVQPCLRDVDQLGRLGGEEFCALLPDTGIAGAALVAERMRAVLEEYRFDWQGQRWPLTASFGIAESAPGDTHAADVLKRADQALYRAKQQGRNVVQAVELG